MHYDLPFAEESISPKAPREGSNALIGGWQIANIGDWRSGTG